MWQYFRKEIGTIAKRRWNWNVRPHCGTTTLPNSKMVFSPPPLTFSLLSQPSPKMILKTTTFFKKNYKFIALKSGEQGIIQHNSNNHFTVKIMLFGFKFLYWKNFVTISNSGKGEQGIVQHNSQSFSGQNNVIWLQIPILKESYDN